MTSRAGDGMCYAMHAEFGVDDGVRGSTTHRSTLTGFPRRRTRFRGVLPQPRPSPTALSVAYYPGLARVPPRSPRSHYPSLARVPPRSPRSHYPRLARVPPRSRGHTLGTPASPESHRALAVTLSALQPRPSPTALCRKLNGTCYNSGSGPSTKCGCRSRDQPSSTASCCHC